MPKTEHPGWIWTNRVESVWSLIERFAIWAGAIVMLIAGPTGHAIGGLVALYYVIPLSMLGVALIVVGFKRRASGRRVPEPATPIQREHTRQRIRIADLAAQYGNTLYDITFTECDIIGPALLCCAGRQLTNYDPTYVASSEDSYLLAIGTERPDGAISLADCIFKRCRFFDITWGLLPHQIAEVKASIAGKAKPPS